MVNLMQELERQLLQLEEMLDIQRENFDKLIKLLKNGKKRLDLEDLLQLTQRLCLF
jgi:hypothetical protein